jgi:excinuclease ABC subunit C
MTDASGRVLYVGKAKSLRTRLMSYFRAKYPEDKAARILHAASDLSFDYAPSEFAASLAELRLIRKFRPPYNVAMNRNKKYAFLVLTDEAFPRLIATTMPDKLVGRRYGPFPSPMRTTFAARVLADLLAIRDCRLDLKSTSAVQEDFFSLPQRAACPRFDFGTCLGPCIGANLGDYPARVEALAAFCEGRVIAPVDRVINEMGRHAADGNFDAAIRWREKFEGLEWLLAASTRTRNAIELLTFAYRDPGSHGDDRIYLIRHGEIRACYPDPVSPIEREAFAGAVRDELQQPMEPAARIDAERLHQRLLVMSWFRTHPEAWRRTTRLETFDGRGARTWG